MKVIFVIDSLKDIKQKDALFKSRFGGNLIYVANSNFVDILPSFGIEPNAIYNTNVARLVHNILLTIPHDSVVIYYTSFDIDEQFLQKFLIKVGDGLKVVDVVPHYNIAEQIFHWGYNIYVKSLFKIKDSLASPKIQYLPRECVEEILSSNFANKMFEVNPECVKKMQVEDKQQNKTLKQKSKFNINYILPIIIAILVTMIWLFVVAEFSVNFVGGILFIAAYALDIVVTYILRYKRYFDLRFFN